MQTMGLFWRRRRYMVVVNLGEDQDMGGFPPLCEERVVEMMSGSDPFGTITVMMGLGNQQVSSIWDDKS